MPSRICFAQVLLYADDTVLLFASKTAIELEASLNTDINRISSWVQENKLFLHMSKTEYVAHQRLKREDSISLSCNEFSLTESESFKYFGVVIDQHLGFNNHTEHVVNKVSRKLGALRRLRSYGCSCRSLQYNDFTHF